MDEQAVRAYFKFNEADINANRSGWLTEEQQKRLAGEKKTMEWGNIGCSAVLLLIPIGVDIWALPEVIKNFQQGKSEVAWPVLIFAMVITLVLGGILVGFMIGAFRGSKKPIVLKTVTGPINLVAVERRTSHKAGHSYIQHELHVNELMFNVSQEAGGWLPQGELVTLYYAESLDLENGHEIVSLETQRVSV